MNQRNERKAVLDSAKILLDRYASDIIDSEQVILSIVPGTGHGDDIWLRSESIHCVAEVTASGSGRRWRELNPRIKRNITVKLRHLNERQHVTDRYLFVGSDSIVNALQRKPDGQNVVVLNFMTGAEQRDGNR